MNTVNLFNTEPSNSSARRNGFDLSYHNIFSTKSGIICPCMVTDLKPNDYIEIKTSNFTRTQTLRTAAYTRMTEYVDYFFVPYRLVWRNFENMLTGLKEQHSSLFNPNGYNIPTASNHDIRTFFFGTGTGAWNAARVNALLDSRFTNPVFGNLTREKKRAIITHAARLMDMLGYGFVDDRMYDTDNHVDAELGNYYNYGTSTFGGQRLNMFRVLAYNYIWYQYYRNKNWSSISQLQLRGFNVDDITTINVERLDMIFYCAYQFAPRYKDLFTSLHSITESIINTTDNQEINGISLDNNAYRTPYSYVSGTDGHESPQVNADGDTLQSISAQNIRTLLSFDRYARRKELAKHDIVNELKKLYDADSPMTFYLPKHLGTHTSRLNIGEVTATAASDKNELAEIAGKGVSASDSNDTIKFTANEHGLILGLHYIIPIQAYQSSRLDKWNCKNNLFDYYQAEFDNLGYVPVEHNEYAQDSLDGQTSDEIIGYAPRYYEYKQKLDEVHGQFNSVFEPAKDKYALNGVFSSWVTPYGRSRDIGFYVHPEDLDNVFGLYANEFQDTDQFLCHYAFDIRKASDMSVLGIPTV